MLPGRDVWWHDVMADRDVEGDCPCEPMDAEDVLFILYTSGSTGKPKGVYHTTGGYLTYAAHTSQISLRPARRRHPLVHGRHRLDHRPFLHRLRSPGPWRHLADVRERAHLSGPGPVLADLPEVQGEHLLHRAHGRALAHEVRAGLDPEARPVVAAHPGLGRRAHQPRAWMWYHEHIGKGKLPIVDTWWQTETGGLMISPLPYATTLKPGSATLPLPGIDAVIVDKDNVEVGPNQGGFLVIRKPWPGMLRGIWGAPERFKQQYFNGFKGCYESGDGARRDEDGYFWIMGRVDDVINVSGHRMGTAEIESALVSHPTVAEAAVVGMPHEIKGQSIYAYVTLKAGYEEDEELLKALKLHVRKEIGPIAAPEVIQFAPGLPKTRSGKIMRRILRKIAANEVESLGDTSTLADPSVVTELIDGKKKLFA